MFAEVDPTLSPPALSPLLLVRADASARIGAGHVMRCLALAQAWIDAGGRALFASHALPEALARRLAEEGIAVEAVTAEPGSPEDARQCAALALARRAAWVVTDGYGFGDTYHTPLCAGGFRVLTFDDKGHLERYVVDLVLNPNIQAGEIDYGARAPHTRLLLGCRYAPLRREFRAAPAAPRLHPPLARRLLLMLGGSDPHGHTGRLLGSLTRPGAPELEITVVAGPTNRARAELARRWRGAEDRVRVLVDVREMTPLILAADLAVSSAGSAVWEMARFGTPMVLGAMLDVEVLLASRLARAGGCLYLGPLDELEPERLIATLAALLSDRDARARLGETAVALVDGQGAARVVAEMIGADAPSLGRE